MNRFFILAMTFLFFMTSRAQNVANPYPKTVTVTGSAEMEIVPDEIYVMVDLKEYEKKGSAKVSIDKIRQDFLTAVRSLGLPDSAVSVAAYDGYNGNPWLRKNNKKEELLASITYQVKLKSAAQVDQLVDKLDDNATSNFYIARTSHSKLDQFRKNLKIQAVKAAKEKAGYLAEAIGEQVGVAVTINEPNEYFQPYYGRVANSMMKVQSVEMDQAAEPQADFKKMKLKYDVTVVFALK